MELENRIIYGLKSLKTKYLGAPPFEKLLFNCILCLNTSTYNSKGSVLYKTYNFLIKKITHVYCTNVIKNTETNVLGPYIKMIICILFLK